MAPLLVSLGLFILDEHTHLDNIDAPTELQLGGGGLFGCIGARMFLEAGQAVNLVHRGYDWRSEDTATLERYGVVRWSDDRPSEKTVRARFTYHANGETSWELTTPAVRHTPHDLLGTDLNGCAFVHFLNYPDRMLGYLEDIHKMPGWLSKIVWEPHPNAASPDALDGVIKALPHIDIFSPNAKEAGKILSIPADSVEGHQSLIEKCCLRFAELGAKDIVVIRSGPLGACLWRKGWANCRWVPAFILDQQDVVDDTGAGNAFLGGLVAGLLLANDDLFEAALYASVSASYTIEQYGLPVLNDDGSWNKSSRPLDRVADLRKRV